MPLPLPVRPPVYLPPTRRDVWGRGLSAAFANAPRSGPGLGGALQGIGRSIAAAPIYAEDLAREEYERKLKEAEYQRKLQQQEVEEQRRVAAEERRVKDQEFQDAQRAMLEAKQDAQQRGRDAVAEETLEAKHGPGWMLYDDEDTRRTLDQTRVLGIDPAEEEARRLEDEAKAERDRVTQERKDQKHAWSEQDRAWKREDRAQRGQPPTITPDPGGSGLVVVTEADGNTYVMHPPKKPGSTAAEPKPFNVSSREYTRIHEDEVKKILEAKEIEAATAKATARAERKGSWWGRQPHLEDSGENDWSVEDVKAEAAQATTARIANLAKSYAETTAIIDQAEEERRRAQGSPPDKVRTEKEAKASLAADLAATFKGTDIDARVDALYRAVQADMGSTNPELIAAEVKRRLDRARRLAAGQQ